MTDSIVIVKEDNITIIEVAVQGPAGADSTVPGPAGPQGPQGPAGADGTGGGGPSQVPVSVFNGGSPEIVFDDTGEVVLVYAT